MDMVNQAGLVACLFVCCFVLFRHMCSMHDLSSQPGIEAMLPAVEAWKALTAGLP